MKSTYVVSSVTCSARAARVAHGDHLRSAANRRVGAKTAPQHLERVTTTSRRRPRTIHAHGRPGAAISNAYASPQASNSPASANPGTSYSEHKPKTPPPDLPSLLLDSRIVYIGMPVRYMFNNLNWETNYALLIACPCCY